MPRVRDDQDHDGGSADVVLVAGRLNSGFREPWLCAHVSIAGQPTYDRAELSVGFCPY
jgi:hypothetical protein